MGKRRLLGLMAQGEGKNLEFKESSIKLPGNLFETICAFLNTDGGEILLGVSDDGKISGVNKNAVLKLKKDVANLSNNPQKLDPVFMLSALDIKIEGKTILYIKVPESSMVHKTNNEVFIRNEDGDYKVTQIEKIAEIVNRKKGYFSEQTVYPYIKFEDFNSKLIKRAKNLIKINNEGHPWTEINDRAFLERAGFYKRSKGGKEGYTLAAALFFGTDELIHSIVPAYKFDALVRKFNTDRYDDRLTVRTNLLDAYDLLMGFIEKHINDPFYLEGDTRISLRAKIFRELVANIIAHREYLTASPAVITIFKDKIVFKNPNNPRQHGIIDPKNFTPYAKNPTISKFMLQMGRVEEIGSGMKNVYKYLPLFKKDAHVEFIDDEFFSTVVDLKTREETGGKTMEENGEDITLKIMEFLQKNNIAGLNTLLNQKLGDGWEKTKIRLGENQNQVGRKDVKILGENQIKIIALIVTNKNITTNEIGKLLKISNTAVEYNILKLKKLRLLKRIGPDKGGFWQINKNRNTDYVHPEETIHMLGENRELLRRKKPKKLGINQIKIISLILNNSRITTREIGNQIGISNTAVENNISKLKQKGIVRRIGPNKGGHWEIDENFKQDFESSGKITV